MTDTIKIRKSTHIVPEPYISKLILPRSVQLQLQASFSLDMESQEKKNRCHMAKKNTILSGIWTKLTNKLSSQTAGSRTTWIHPVIIHSWPFTNLEIDHNWEVRSILNWWTNNRLPHIPHLSLVIMRSHHLYPLTLACRTWKDGSHTRGYGERDPPRYTACRSPSLRGLSPKPVITTSIKTQHTRYTWLK